MVNFSFPKLLLALLLINSIFPDLLGVPDRDVWAYGQALRRLSVAKGFGLIAFSRLKDLVNVNVPDELDEMTYVANASYFRLALLNEFSRSNFDASLRISEDEDTCLTYRGYIKFLSTDLRHVYPVGEDRSNKKYKKGVEYIAMKMLARGDVSNPILIKHMAIWVLVNITP
jgi:pyoverdine/dityrosine biosynthesis protein Dit1